MAAKKKTPQKKGAVKAIIGKIFALPFVLVFMLSKGFRGYCGNHPVLVRKTAMVLVLAAALFGWFYTIRASVMADPKYTVHAEEITVGDLPVEFNVECKNTFRLSGLEDAQMTIFDRDLSSRIVASAKKMPWVREARVAGRALPNSVELKLTPRWPRLLVQKEYSLSPVDYQGCHLESRYYNMEVLQRKLPKVVGVRTEPPLAAGYPWQGQGVQAALELMQIIEQRKLQFKDDPKSPYRFFHLSTINVKNIDGRQTGKPEIITQVRAQSGLGASFVPIYWSWSPAPLKPGYKTLEEQVASLEENLAKVDGMLRMYDRGFFIDVRFPKTYAQLSE